MPYTKSCDEALFYYYICCDIMLYYAVMGC